MKRIISRLIERKEETIAAAIALFPIDFYWRNSNCASWPFNPRFANPVDGHLQATISLALFKCYTHHLTAAVGDLFSQNPTEKRDRERTTCWRRDKIQCTCTLIACAPRSEDKCGMAAFWQDEIASKKEEEGKEARYVRQSLKE